ncbi:MAG TPA: acyl-CoA dehydrogenase family protein [Pyrinomonadaceae bacterium]|jgi:alkylation response protein AidB-like acyl-CoA dehydrogenase|nr:acyl-CoA dehydrogenase family protein [Pyrinomonadaceae bacterium]
MDFDLSKPQKLLKESARAFFARECGPERVRALVETETAHDDGLWQAIADQGWTGLLVAEEHGGLGLGLVELAAVAEEMGRACLPGPFLSTLLAGALIARAGNPEQRARYLGPIATGELKATVALLEESATWDAGAVRLAASRVGGGDFSVTGRKLFVPDAEVCELIICVAREGDDLVLLPVERAASGLYVKPMPSMDGTRKLYEVSFEGVSIADTDALGADGDARGALEGALEVATAALSAEMVGGMQWVLDTTVEFAKTRQQFGRAIGSFQAVQHQCADMLLMTESALSAAYYAAWALSENTRASSVAVAVAKAYCSDAYREVCNRGVQVHGGIGFTWEHDLQLYYKRSKSSETLFGDATFHRERIARLVVDNEGRREERRDEGGGMKGIE